jgi:hypothetical protein
MPTSDYTTDYSVDDKYEAVATLNERGFTHAVYNLLSLGESFFYFPARPYERSKVVDRIPRRAKLDHDLHGEKSRHISSPCGRIMVGQPKTSETW